MEHEININVELNEDDPQDLLGIAEMMWQQVSEQFEMTIESLEVLKIVFSNSAVVFSQKCDAEIARLRAESNPI